MSAYEAYLEDADCLEFDLEATRERQRDAPTMV